MLKECFTLISLVLYNTVVSIYGKFGSYKVIGYIRLKLLLTLLS